MPEIVTISCDGPVVQVGELVQTTVGGLLAWFPRKFVYNFDPDQRLVVIPRWLAEEKDVEHRAREGDARPPRRS
jgi:hypothetical protein